MIISEIAKQMFFHGIVTTTPCSSKISELFNSPSQLNKKNCFRFMPNFNFISQTFRGVCSLLRQSLEENVGTKFETIYRWDILGESSNVAVAFESGVCTRVRRCHPACVFVGICWCGSTPVRHFGQVT